MSETREGLIAYRLRHDQKGRATHRVMAPLETQGLTEEPRRMPMLRMQLCYPLANVTMLSLNWIARLRQSVSAKVRHKATLEDRENLTLFCN